MRIVVCVCTRYRPESLLRLLSSIADCDRGSHHVETVVTVNEDDGVTLRALGKHAPAMPFTVIEEHRPGVSHARNAALSYVQANFPSDTLVLWADDDVIVDHHWIMAMAGAAARHGDTCIYGGRIVPVASKVSQQALAQHLLTGRFKSTFYAAYQPCRETCRTEHIPYGPNFAFFLSSVNGEKFPTDMGPGSSSNALGEETEFLRLLVNRGLEILYCHESLAWHQIGEERFREDWCLDRADKAARTYAVHKLRGLSVGQRLKLRRRYKRKLRKYRITVHLLWFSRFLRLDHKIKASYYRSFLKEIDRRESGTGG